MIQLYNSLTRQKEQFRSLHYESVGMYVCGITPYDTTHLGHAFTYTAFDVLYRLLRLQGYEVNYTQNVTDIDDDILKRAKRDKNDWLELGKFWTDKYVNDMRTLNNVKPTHYVKATETMNTIIEIVSGLVEQGIAYEKEGNVYFDTAKDPEYGKLSGFTRKEMIKLSKERGADPDDPRKKDPLDFILWQKALPEEPSWESIWGNGRPGWHIECSAMAYKYIDKKLDIHGGGSDLIYPHHESEIAQSEHFTEEKPFARFWLHTGAVGYQGEKMSKSLGNLIMVSELLKTYSPNAIRYLLLSHHYREPWEYQETEIKEAAETVKKIENALATYFSSEHSESRSVLGSRQARTIKNNHFSKFIEALSDDLGTPKALKILNETVKTNNLKEAKKMWEVLGFTL